jgi:hypothetical protein
MLYYVLLRFFEVRILQIIKVPSTGGLAAWIRRIALHGPSDAEIEDLKDLADRSIMKLTVTGDETKDEDPAPSGSDDPVLYSKGQPTSWISVCPIKHTTHTSDWLPPSQWLSRARRPTLCQQSNRDLPFEQAPRPRCSTKDEGTQKPPRSPIQPHPAIDWDRPPHSLLVQTQYGQPLLCCWLSFVVEIFAPVFVVASHGRDSTWSRQRGGPIENLMAC